MTLKPNGIFHNFHVMILVMVVALVLNGHKFDGCSRALVVRFSQVRDRVSESPSQDIRADSQDVPNDADVSCKLSNKPSEGVQYAEGDGLCGVDQGPLESQSEWFQNSSESAHFAPLMPQQLFRVVFVPVITPVPLRYDGAGYLFYFPKTFQFRHVTETDVICSN